jgi:hypothetical protein
MGKTKGSRNASGIGRRSVVRMSGITAAAVMVERPITVLAASSPRHAADVGPLREAIDATTGLPLLRLPSGFRYFSFGWPGDPVAGGKTVPAGIGSSYLVPVKSGDEVACVRMHLRSHAKVGGGAPSGATTLIFDQRAGRFVSTMPLAAAQPAGAAATALPPLRLIENNVVLRWEVNGLQGDFRDQEWSGAALTPNGLWLIASIREPGVTFAITGPWPQRTN